MSDKVKQLFLFTIPAMYYEYGGFLNEMFFQTFEKQVG